MDQNAWIMLLVGIALSCGLFALGVVLYPKLKSQKQGYPFEAEIEAALLPVVFQGICTAYRLSENSMDTIHQRIKGVCWLLGSSARVYLCGKRGLSCCFTLIISREQHG